MSTWIDFKELRAQLTFEKVLQHYKVEVKAKGRQFLCYCPLPKHDGKKNSKSFSANLERGIFQCFGCGAKGNLLDFAVLMNGGSPDVAEDLRKTALSLQESFGLGKKAKPSPPRQELLPPRPPASGTLLINAKLDFELKTLDYAHPYLRSRGFTDETIKTFGLGYCSKGYQTGRIAIPLHDQLGRLIGYAGRIVDDALIDDEHPRYRFPCPREHKGITYELHKTEFLYGGHRIKEPVDDLVVVEGFPSVWWLTQHAIANVVGLMGWSCSEAQAKLIALLTKPNGRVWLLPDADKSGMQCVESALPQIARYRFVRWWELDEGKQPTDYGADVLKARLNLN